MAGIDYRKVAEIAEAKGQIKKAADYYSHVDRGKAYELYKNILSQTNNKEIISDIEKRLVKLNAPLHLKNLVSEAKKRGLEKRTITKYSGRKFWGILSIASLIVALFLVSFNATGNTISGLTLDESRWIGVCFFLCGLIFTFIYFKEKKK